MQNQPDNAFQWVKNFERAPFFFECEWGYWTMIVHLPEGSDKWHAQIWHRVDPKSPDASTKDEQDGFETADAGVRWVEQWIKDYVMDYHLL